MSAMTDNPFDSPNCGSAPPRPPKPGEQVWRLYQGPSIQSCELRDDSKSSAGWDVYVFDNGELLFSRRCANEQGARFVAESFKQDLIRTGWTESMTSRPSES